MPRKKLSSPTIAETKIEDGSPKKGFNLVVKWAWWIVQAFIAYFFAAYVWGELVRSPSVFDISLSFLSISALYGIVKSGVTVFFKRVNYLYLYSTFFIGLWLYKWLLNLILPTGWLAYWWLPYLFIAPLILELPIINLGITKFISWKLYSNLMWIAVVSVSPYVFIYAIIFSIVHPIQTVSYLKKKKVLSAVLRILVGFSACSIAIRLILHEMEILLVMLYGFITYLAIIIVIISLFGFFAFLNARKVDFSIRVGAKRLYHIAQIIVFPLWILNSVLILPNSDTQTQSNEQVERIFTIPATSLSIGVMAIAFALQYIQSNVILLYFWVVNFIGAASDLILTFKPSLIKTKGYSIFSFIVFILALPFVLFSGIIASVEQAQNQPVSEKPTEETSISESNAG